MLAGEASDELTVLLGLPEGVLVVASDPVAARYSQVVIEHLARESDMKQAPVHVGESDHAEVKLGNEANEGGKAVDVTAVVYESVPAVGLDEPAEPVAVKRCLGLRHVERLFQEHLGRVQGSEGALRKEAEDGASPT